jgi:branched-chain amino acid transport system substrate-binding protein
MKLRWSPLLLALSIVVAACGQKANVGGDAVTAGGGFGETPVEGAAVDTDGDGVVDVGTGATPAVTGDSGAGGGSSAASGGGGAGAGSTGGGTAAGSGGGTASGGTGGGGGGAPPAGDRTGITDEEIVIGIHAPVSGAAPFPQTSFADGAAV